MKPNANLAVLNLFARLGSGFDIVPGGELARALRAGADPQRIVFAGVGKQPDEMAEAVQAGILMFNVESTSELEALATVARRLVKRAPVAVRVNPDVDPKTHPYISTGMKTTKFGIDIDSALAEYERARSLSHVQIMGVDCHIGSQLTDVAPFVDALGPLRLLIERLERLGISTAPLLPPLF